MPSLRRIVTKLTTPDRPLGRVLMRARMLVQSAPMRLGRRDGDTRHFLGLCDRLVPGYTMISVDRLRSLHGLAMGLARAGIPGSIVECGTWNGGGAALMAAASIRGGVARDVWLFDSFEGLPEPTADDPPEVHEAYFAGWCSGDAEVARRIVREVGVPEGRIHVIEGWFERTLPTADVGPIALLHVDSDWYASVRLSLETFFDAMSPGGVIVFDDYEHWVGCKKAVDEFLAARGVEKRPRPSGRTAAYLVVPGGGGMP